MALRRPAEDVEGHLLEVATGIDISGRGLDLIPTNLQADVVTAWPRMDLAAEFSECLRVQGERKPTSRAADLTRGGLADALRDHPLEGAVRSSAGCLAGQASSRWASSPREVTPVLVNTLRRWNATVRGDTQH